MTALLKLWSLTREQRRFLWRKQISDARTPEDWLAFFGPLADFDRKRGASGCLNVFVGGAGALLLVMGIPVLLTRGSLALGLVMIGAGVGCAAFVSCRIVFQLRGEHLGPVLNPLLAVLREDLKAGDRVSLTVDLHGPERRENKVGERRLPLVGAYTKVVQTTYAECWLKGDATLADGTRLDWIETDYVRRTNLTKKNARGKTKMKEKYRVVTQVRLQVGWRKDRFELRGPPASGVVVSDDGSRLWIKQRRSFRFPYNERFGAAHFVQAVATAYRLVQPAGGAA